MKKSNKLLIVLVSIPVVLLLFFASNIYGYFRFQSYCSNEGGLRVYEPLEKNVGWLADDYDAAHMAAQLKHVGFVRYKDKKDGNFYDLRYVGNNPQKESSFERLPADELKPITYKWKHVSEFVMNEIRLGKFGFEISNNVNDKILVSYYSWSYSQFDRSHTVLNAPSGISCFYKPARNIDEKDDWIVEINTGFKD